MHNQVLMSANKVAKYLNLSVSTVWLYARTNMLPQPIKIGKGSTRWIKESIDTFIKTLNKKE